ncbi:cytochrome c reductase subunit 7(VI) [Gracilaria domingensis]|nr:cytochrome c reductase subunit 7(VI) [Gracilaria domingensis]
MSVAKYMLKIPGVHSLVSRAARAYQASVGAELKRYGLRYDDLLNEFDDEVKHAISKLPPHELEMRNKRLKRAIDLDVKKTYLPEHIQEQEDVWNPYLRKRIEALKQKRVERQIVE